MDKSEEKQIRKIDPALIAVMVFATILAVLIYHKAINAPPLLDEAYIVNWLKGTLSGSNLMSLEFFRWTGPQLGDTWNYVSSSFLLLLGTASQSSPAFIRATNLIMHLINVGLVYAVMSMALTPHPKMFMSNKVSWLAAFSALCFAIYPITAESVFWLGGLAYNLGLLLLLVSFLLYLMAKQQKSWLLIGIGSITYLLALFADSALWSASFTLVALELARSFIGDFDKEKTISQKTIEETEDIEDAVDKLLEAEKTQSGESAKESTNKEPEKTENKTSSQVTKEEDVFDTLLPVLPYLALGAIVPLGGLPTYGTETLAKEMIIQPGDWASALKAFWFPVNQSINEGYNKLYSFLYIVYGIGAAAVPIALFKSRSYRQHVMFLLVWLAMATVPHLHHTIVNADMAGSRWFYHASVPISSLAILYLFASVFVLKEFKKEDNFILKLITATFSIALTGCLLFFCFARTKTQVASYVSATNVVSKLKKSIFNVASKAKSDFIVVRTVPFYATVSRISSPFNLVLFDAKTQLIKSPRVVGGKYKDILKSGKRKDLTMHWEHNHISLLPIDLAVAGQGNGRMDKPYMDGIGIEQRLIPPLRYWKTAKLDKGKNTFELFSNRDAGPVLNVSANGFDPLGPDFVYIDVKIDTPAEQPDAEVELGWLTTWGKDFERRDRLTKSHAITNDDKYHRYFLPVRSSSWSTNGVIQQLSFGFPKSATVTIKEIGAIDAPERIPTFEIAEGTTDTPKNSRSYVSGFYDYPNNPELGLATVYGSNKVVKFKYDASGNSSAVRTICEISRPNKFFENPNGYKLSKNKLKVMRLEKASGVMQVNTEDLKEPGIYSFRVFGTDKDGNIMYNASDAVLCLINQKLEIKN